MTRIPLALALALGLTGCPSGEPSEPTPEPPCTPTSPAEAAACVDADSYVADLNLLAVPRPPGSNGWQDAQDHCRTVLTDLGFAVEDHDYGTGTNIIGTKAGTDDDPRTVVVSAHYDSVDDCAGADDNASGVAGALEVARALAYGTWQHDLVIACWDEEESGLVGSSAWTARAAAAGTQIDSAISLEMIAYKDTTPGSQTFPTGFEVVFPDAYNAVDVRAFRGDFIALISDTSSAPMVQAYVDHAPDSLPIIGIEVPDNLLDSGSISDLRRSDHAAFWREGLPGIMVTDTANFRYAGYHCGDGGDTVDRLDLEFAADVARATAAASADRLNAQ